MTLGRLGQIHCRSAARDEGEVDQDRLTVAELVPLLDQQAHNVPHGQDLARHP
jgi:hypothetical protein